MRKIKQSKKIIFFSSGRADLGILLKIANCINLKNIEIIFLISSTEKKIFTDASFGISFKKKYKNYFIKQKKNLINNKNLIKNFSTVFNFTSKKIQEIKPSLIFILGDRYEALASANSANLSGVPIVHFHGGEITENSYDNFFRHSITKLSSFHFASHSDYQKRIIQMGEEPKNVVNIGAPGLMFIKNNLLKKKEVENNLKIKIKKNFFLLTYHPETLKNSQLKLKLKIILNSVKKILDNDTTFLFTEPGNDISSPYIEKKLLGFCRENLNCYYKKNLGNKLYHSCINLSSGVIGNSSSGIIEVPSFKVFSIDIGDRQKGRVKPDSVISINYNERSIIKNINFLKSSKQNLEKEIKNPFFKNNCCDLINKSLKKILSLKENLRIKKFYQLKN